MRTCSLALILLTGACTTPTQIVLTIDAAIAVPCALDRIEVVAEGSETVMVEQVIEPSSLPLTVALSPDNRTTFNVEVRGYRGDALLYLARGELQFVADRLLGAEVTLLPECSPATPCVFGDLEAFDGLASAVARPDCVPTATHYELREDTFEHHFDACSGSLAFSGRVLEDDEDRTLALFGPDDLFPGELNDFGFRFFGERVERIEVSSEGVIQFGSSPLDLRGVTGVALDEANVPRPGVAVFWDDLRMRDGVCFAMTGGVPNRRLWFTWRNACLGTSCRDVDDLNFSVALDEGTNEVLVTFGDMVASNPDRAAGIRASVGLSYSPAACDAAECGSDGLCDGTGVPCGFTQAFARELQSLPLPTFRFSPAARSATR